MKRRKFGLTYAKGVKEGYKDAFAGFNEWSDGRWDLVNIKRTPKRTLDGLSLRCDPVPDDVPVERSALHDGLRLLTGATRRAL